MRYWDSSAIVVLLVRQTASPRMECLLQDDPELFTWWGTPVECCSAIMRLAREGTLDRQGLRAAQDRLTELRQGWDEVLPGEACRRTAERLLRVHPLCAADAMQLAAALVAADHEPERLDVVCLDQRLADAARREGFTVLEGA
jgi:predicted nucleic acid-binding protein